MADGPDVERLRARLRKRERELRLRERELRETQARLGALEASTALQVGRRLAAAARKPGKGLIGLPRDLLRMARGQRAAATSAVPLRADGGWPELRGEVGDDERLVFGASLRARGFVIAGALTRETRAAFEGRAHVVGLRPFDAGVAVDQVDPDVVVFEAAACVAGYPWAYLGDPAAVDRQRALLAVFEAARPLGRPVVLWRNGDPSPGLGGLGWDAVIEAPQGAPVDVDAFAEART